MRSKWKGAYCSETLKKEIASLKVIKTNSRESTILPEFMGKTVMIHNGKGYTTLKLEKEHIGHKLGEFSITKKIPVYKAGKNN